MLSLYIMYFGVYFPKEELTRYSYASSRTMEYVKPVVCPGI